MRLLNAAVIRKELGRCQTGALLLFLDYDGTLTPIVNRPERAKLTKATRKILASFSSDSKKAIVVVISGRDLSDLKKRIGIKGLIYVGNHGLEMEGRGLRFVHPRARASRLFLKPLARRLKREFAAVAGIQVEDKRLTLSIHYRRAAPANVVRARRLLQRCMNDVGKKSQICLKHGKKVWEIHSGISWDKGDAARYLEQRVFKKDKQKRLPIYFGDDLTDESAFKVLRRKGLTVRVTLKTQEPSAAQFYLRNSAGVRCILKGLSRGTPKGGKA